MPVPAVLWQATIDDGECGVGWRDSLGPLTLTTHGRYHVRKMDVIEHIAAPLAMRLHGAV